MVGTEQRTMRTTFGFHFARSATEKDELLAHATFVLDANVLLAGYRSSTETQSLLLSAMRRVGERLWVPHQAAAEFYRNRVKVIEGRRGDCDNALQAIGGTLRLLSSGREPRQAHLELASLLDRLEPIIQQLRDHLKARRKSATKPLHDDRYLVEVEQIVGEHFGDEPSDQQRQVWEQDARLRLGRMQPPGYLDADKGEPDSLGDPILWFEILSYAERSARPVVLVTEDRKEDWWQFEGGVRQGARSELRHEMLRRANQEFELLDLESWLKSVPGLNDTPSGHAMVDRAIAELREILDDDRGQALDQVAKRLSQRDSIELAIMSWLSSVGVEAVTAGHGSELPDFIGVVAGLRVGLEWCEERSRGSVVWRLGRLRNLASRLQLDAVMVIVVRTGMSGVKRLGSELRSVELLPGEAILLGERRGSRFVPLDSRGESPIPRVGSVASD